jgi:hypothetical protein
MNLKASNKILPQAQPNVLNTRHKTKLFKKKMTSERSKTPN